MERYIIPAIILLIFSLVLFANMHYAKADDQGHPPEHMMLHEKFYSKWNMPNNGGYRVNSCCSNTDCYPTPIKKEGEKHVFLHRETQTWLEVPETKLEQNQPDEEESPDGQSHVCASKNGVVFCATMGSGQ